MRILLFLLTLFCAFPSQASELNYAGFNTLPIMDEGRLKPMQSFARLKLKTLSGSTSLKDMSAEQWLATMFFKPKEALNIPVFQITNKTVLAQLDIKEPQPLYTLMQLRPGLIKLEPFINSILLKQDDLRTADERALVSLYKRSGLFMSLSQSLELIKSAPLGNDEDFKSTSQNWQNLETAFNTKDNDLWNATLKEMNAISKANITKFKVENLYRSIKPYSWIIALYALGILAAIFKKQALSLIISGGGLALHILAIASRIYILSRPPVGTLYESILFVSLITAAIGIFLVCRARDNKSKTPLISGNLAAIGLLGLAPVIAPEKDNLEVLVAVLNTNFWLATHVLCITIGYGVCILMSVLAHFALISRASNPNDTFFKSAQKPLYRISIAALLFTCVGTILGGIWADQSWGRFWGWDPKENGALLITLWLIWIQHGKVSTHLKPVAFTGLLALSSIIVALAWLGVNLLNVGLHSYGFTTGLAGGLAAFCTLELLIILGLSLKIKLNENKAHEQSSIS